MRRVPRNRLEELRPGAPGGARDDWTLEESRENFGVVMRYVEPGYPLRSRFLTHPLDLHAGGDHYHSGGRRWRSRDDPEWRMLAEWVKGKTPACVAEDR